jgi:cobaltochelatase CobN
MDGATARLFSSKPGTYTSGVNLAVLSGAWTDEKDLAGIYISVNGYAYGGGRKGRESQIQFASALENVSLTFNKVVSDDHDLLGCCCYYSNQGGLTAAARQMSERKVNTYYGDTRERDSVGVRTLSDEIGRVVRSKLLNPKWIEGMKAHGYKGAADMMKKITRVYGWGASTGEVEDAIFDGIADTYVNDPEMRRFFGNNNPHAAEEISRRLLEAESRGIWDADEETLDRLRSSYLEIESWMEDLSDGEDIQGGEASMISPEELPIGKDIAELMNKIHDKKARR